MSVFCLRKRVASALFACSMLVPVLMQGQVVSIIAGLEKNNPVDGAAALNTTITGVAGIAMDNEGNVFFTAGNAVRKISATGVLATVAGGTAAGKTGDGGPAKVAKLSGPTGLALDKEGNLFVSDSRNNCVRKIDNNGIITTVAGYGGVGYTDDTLAIHAQLNVPNALAVDDSGNLYIADINNGMVRKVNTAGIIHTISGSKKPKYIGSNPISGVPAREVGNQSIDGIVVLKNGDVIYTDKTSCILRKITPDGIIHTFAGSWKYGVTGDNAPAISVTLGNPLGLTKDVNDNVYLAEAGGGRIRKIDAAGIITTVAGGGTAKAGKALEVGLTPEHISADNKGNIVINQKINNIAYYAPAYSGEEENLIVFPNPCQSFVNVVLPSTFAESATVYAIDASGRVVATIIGSTNRNVGINFRDAGVYTILGVSNHGKWTGKVSVATAE